MFAGFDTSNYTTSAAVMCDSTIKNYKKMLSVAEKARGLRQSDAVFSIPSICRICFPIWLKILI